MATPTIQNSTIVRARVTTTRAVFSALETVAPRLGGVLAERLWFTLPPAPRDQPLPTGGTAFTVPSQKGAVQGHVWGHGPVVYLVHGWGGRGSQLTAFVEPLVAAGHRVVMFDAPSHGGSGSGPSGPRRSTAVELGRALDDVAARFGPARAVVAHSLGAMATLLAMQHGWLGTARLALIAPMADIDRALDVFCAMLGVGPRTRAHLSRRVARRAGLPFEEFTLARLTTDGLPTLVVHDRGDRQAPYDAGRELVEGHTEASMVTTTGLGHQRILRDRDVVSAVVRHVAAAGLEEAEQSELAS